MLNRGIMNNSVKPEISDKNNKALIVAGSDLPILLAIKILCFMPNN